MRDASARSRSGSSRAGDAGDLGEGLLALEGGGAAATPFQFRQDAALGAMVHANDERKAVPGEIGGIELAQFLQLARRQTLQPGTGLFEFRGRDELAALRLAAGQLGMSAQQAHLLALGGRNWPNLPSDLRRSAGSRTSSSAASIRIMRSSGNCRQPRNIWSPIMSRPPIMPLRIEGGGNPSELHSRGARASRATVSPAGILGRAPLPCRTAR
nr:hypothetical protein [Ancylobacter defluvii]